MKSLPNLAITLITVLLFSCAATQQTTGPEQEPATPQQQIERALDHPALDVANVGIFVQDPKSRSVIYQQNPHKLFMPASNQKLITAAAALSSLGPEYRYTTKIYADGMITDGVLQGDLYIRGSGDPTLSGRFHDGDITRDLENWADSLSALGIRRIEGDIIADANMFEGDRIGKGWSYDDLSYWYAAQISALSFNDNCLDVTIVPGDSIGAPAKLSYEPETDYITMQNDLITVHADSVTQYDYHREHGTNRMRFFGKISRSEKAIDDYITVHNPALYTATVFSEILAGEGITFNGEVNEVQYGNRVPEYASMEQMVIYKSPPLSRIVEVINKKSQNFYAEQVLKTLGYERYGKGTFDDGIRAVEAFLGGAGIDTEHLNVADGSGLSRRNLITPFQIATVLRTMYTGSHRDVYFSSLPVGGADGTLSGRFRGTAAQHRVSAKTGYVGFVRTLSGYVKTRDDHSLIFSIMVNHYTTNTSLINNLQDTIVTILASHTLEELLNR